MSNTLAIATVTATLRATLNDVAKNTVNGGTASSVRPDDKSRLPAVGVNIFLYQVTPNPSWRNADLPTRGADGSLLRRPQAALDLHYLLTFYGDDITLDQQRLLGAVVLELHAVPVLSRDAVRQAIQNNIAFLNGSNLADQIELVRVTPANLSLEELSKLWLTFPEVDYVLSAVYVASVVLIETEDRPPGKALPVLKPCVTAVPFSLATIDAVEPQPVELSSPPAPTTITLVGRNLDPTDEVTFNTPGKTDPLIGTIGPGSGGERLTVILPSGLRAGVNTVRLTQLTPAPASPPTSPPCSPHVLSQSNAAAFILRPSIVHILQGSLPGEIVVVVEPLVGPQQQVSLVLNQVGSSAPLAFALPAGAHAAQTDTLVFNTTNFQGGAIPSGQYLARIRVDDAESRLEVDLLSGKFNGPLVTIS